MTQIIFQKQYKKMYDDKRIAITIGMKIHKLAKINEAEVIEGMSDVDLDDDVVIFEPENKDFLSLSAREK